MSRLGSYSRTLDEIFAMSTPKPKPRQSTGSTSVVTTADSKVEVNRSPLASIGDRPTTRHGRSSESSSSSNKTENKSELSESTRTRVDVWTRDDSNEGPPQVDAVELMQALGSKRRNITDSPIMENELSEISSASSEASTSSGNQVQPFTQTRSLRTTSSSKPTSSDSIKIPSIHTAPSTSSSKSSGKESRKSSIIDEREEPKNGVRPTTFTKEAEDNIGKIIPAAQADPPKPPTLTKKPPTPTRVTSAKSIRSIQSLTKRTQIIPPTTKNNSIDQKPARPTRTTTPATIPKRNSAAIRERAFGPRASLNGSQRQRTASTPPKPTVSMVLSNNSESYNMWLERKLESDRKKRQEEKERLKAEEERKKEQQENAERAFRRWQEENQRRFLDEKQRKEREKQEAEEKTEQEKKERRRNAEKTFETWKKRQEEKLREERIRKREEQRHRAQSAQEEKRRQRSENQKVYQKWVEQSLQRQREIKQLNLEKELALRKQEEEEREFKEALSNEAYQLWLEMKKKEKVYSQSLAYKILDFDNEAKKRWPTPWIPTGNTVPRRFVGTGSRRRTIEKPLNIVQQRAKSVY